MSHTQPPAAAAQAANPGAPRSVKTGGWFGPGLLISASFIGPGTITTATVTGANYGYVLAWAIVFSILATIVLQEMSARLGLVTGSGLGEALRETFSHPIGRIFMVVLVVSAIGIGGASYAGGDTTGTGLAISSVTGLPQPVVVVIVAAVILLVLLSGSYRVIERVLACLVLVLAAVFVLTAIVVKPDLLALLKGMVTPTVPTGALLTTIALIGTTVVPYNLFLHANLVNEKWGTEPTGQAVRKARVDTGLSISVGGLITLAVVTTAAGSMFVRGISAESGSDLARQLEPLLGSAAPLVFAIGLFAAGLTSAIAGPLGAAYAITGTLGWAPDLKSWRFKAIYIGVVLIGLVIALTGVNPIQMIVLAQAANGILLPIVAGFLLVAMNRSAALGSYRNGVITNILGGFIFLVVTGLAGYQLVSLF